MGLLLCAPCSGMVAATTISPPNDPSPALPLQDPTAPYERIGRLLMSGSFGPLVAVPAFADST